MDEFSTIRIHLDAAGGRDAARIRTAALVVIRGPAVGQRHLLTRSETIIGRQRDADFPINDRSLSRQHCCIIFDSSGDIPRYTVRELGSTNGTFVNGRRVDEATLADGDKLTLGDVVLKFVLLDTVEEEFHHEVSDLLRTDRQTGLLHIAAFYEELDKALDRARHGTHTLTVIMVDVDGLKRVNDAHGHLMGSEVIQSVAASLRAVCEPARAVPGIYGGDEFIVYVPDGAAGAGMELAERARNAVADAQFLAANGETFGITVSLGMAQYPQDGTAREVLVRCADLALYAAKTGGRNRVVPFTPELNTAGDAPEESPA